MEERAALRELEEEQVGHVSRGGNAIIDASGRTVLQLLWASVPDLEEAVPGPRGHSHPIIGHTQAADTIVVPSQDTCPVSLECIPDVAVEVVVPCEEEAATLGEGDGGDATNDVVVGVSHQLLVSAEVKQPAGGVIRASGKCIAIGKEADGVDVRLVTGEGLPAHAFPHIPEFGRSVTGPRDKESGVRSKGQAHDVPGVASESGRLLACLDVPQSTGGVSGAGDDLIVIQEAAAG